MIKLSWQIIHLLCQTKHDAPEVIHIDSGLELIRETQSSSVPRPQTLKGLLVLSYPRHSLLLGWLYLHNVEQKSAHVQLRDMPGLQLDPELLGLDSGVQQEAILAGRSDEIIKKSA